MDEVNYYEEQLALAVQEGDRSKEAKVCGKLGNAYRKIARYTEASTYVDRSLNIALETSNKNEEANALSSKASILLLQGKLHEALTYYEKCLEVSRGLGQKKEVGKLLTNFGTTYLMLGEHEKATECLEEGLSLVLQFDHDKRSQFQVYGNLANTYLQAGKCHKAKDCYLKVLEFSVETGYKKGECLACLNIASALDRLGRYHEAILYLERNLKIAKEIKDRRGQGLSYSEMGSVYSSLGHYEKAIENHEMRLQIAIEIGDQRSEDQAYGNLSNNYIKLKNYDKAKAYIAKQLAIAVEIDDKYGECGALGNLGSIYLIEKQYKKSIEYQQKRLDIARETTKDRRTEAAALGSMGVAHRRLGDFQKGIGLLQHRLKIESEIDNKEGKGKASFNLGVSYYLHSKEPECENKKEHLKCSEKYLNESLQCHEWLFDQLEKRDEFKISIVDTFVDVYKVLTSVYIETERNEEALVVCERGRARALGDLLSAKYNLRRSESASRGNSFQCPDVQSILSSFSTILFFAIIDYGKIGMTVGAWTFTLGNTPVFVHTKMESHLERELSREEEEAKGTKEDAINQLVSAVYDQIKGREIVRCENRSLDAIEIGDEQDSAVVASKEPDSVGKEKSSSARCAELVDYDAPLEMLFDTLIRPSQYILTQEEIVIVPDGPLSMVPFAALRDSETESFLSDTKRIRLSPSLTTLKILKEASADYHVNTRALIVGVPEVGTVMFRGKITTFPPLPGAECEAKEISKILGEPALNDTTKETIKKKLKDGVAVVHFASHGSTIGEIALTPNRRGESTIASSDDTSQEAAKNKPKGTGAASQTIPGEEAHPEEEDYLLTVKEVQETGIRAQLVVLSCCHSGRGEIKAEGVVGMSRAFLAAGARAVVASLWAIDDNATKEFMIKFYTHLKQGDSAGTSLQQAMKEMRNSELYAKPEHWAPFFLMGDDVTINL